MTQAKEQMLDDDVKKGIKTLKQLLRDPARFESWANETLDMSRLRKK